jgi:hypothetical protein
MHHMPFEGELNAKITLLFEHMVVTGSSAATMLLLVQYATEVGGDVNL